MSYNEQDVYRIPPSPSMTGVMWRDAYFEKCAEVHRVRACAQEDLDANAAELSRLRDLATRWYLADGTSETLPEGEVIRRRIEAAGVLKRAEDVEGMVNAILSVSFDREGESWADTVARRVREYLKEGK